MIIDRTVPSNNSVWLVGSIEQKQALVLRIANMQLTHKFTNYKELYNTVRKVATAYKMYDRTTEYKVTDVIQELGITRHYFIKLAEQGIFGYLQGYNLTIKEKELNKLKSYLEQEKENFLSLEQIQDIYGLRRVVILDAIKRELVGARRYGKSYIVNKYDLPNISKMYSHKKKGA
jgi:hypothetical protein